MSQEGVSEAGETASESMENAPENSEEYVGTGVPAEEAQEAPEEAGGEGVDTGLKIGVDEVIVTVPKEYILRLDHNNVSTIKAGVQVMKRELADHWYSKANGVEVFKG
jgi:hypothetical protein